MFYEHQQNTVEVQDFQTAKRERYFQTIDQQQAAWHANAQRAMNDPANQAAVRKIQTDQAQQAEQLKLNAEITRDQHRLLYPQSTP